MYKGQLLVVLISLFTLSWAQTCWKNWTCTGPTEPAFPGPWQSNIYAPSSRTVKPASYFPYDNIDDVKTYTGAATLSGNGSTVVFDFGKEVGGLATITYTTTGAGALGLAFTEGKNWIGQWSDSSDGEFQGPDGAIYGNFTGAGSYTYVMPDKSLRGGFRYLSLFLITNGSTTLDISNIELEIGFAPTWSNLQAYQGYFHCSDEELNKIWYSGAYTLQTNSVPTNTGRQVPFLHGGWANNATLGPGDVIIVDGAKRDRAVWPGDMGVAVPSTFYSIGDLTDVSNALSAMYQYQNADGSFPEAGPPLLQQGSDTYHMWTMIGTYNYILFTNDTSFLATRWTNYTRAMNYIYNKVLPAPSGLLNVTGTRDWARWQQGFNNTEANFILYRTLITGAALAEWQGYTSVSSNWTSLAETLMTNINYWCFDVSYGAFKDNATNTTLHPQDANSFSILFNATTSAREQSIADKLVENWTPIGPDSPELPNNISPFITSFELQARLSISDTQRALTLLRDTWGWYLNNGNGTESTVIEGYRTNGTFGYRAERGYDYDYSYPSHSHGWSSGPTSALTNYIAGIRITGRAGSQWEVAPQFGDLSFAEAGFTTILGKFQVAWSLFGGGYDLTISVPRGTTGEVVLPLLTPGRVPGVSVNGQGRSCGLKTVGYSQGATLTLAGGDYTINVR